MTTDRQAWRDAVDAFTDGDLDAELVAHAQGRLLDRVFPPQQSDPEFADRYIATLTAVAQRYGADQ